MRRLILGGLVACLGVAPIAAATTLSPPAANFADPVGGNSSYYHYVDTDGIAGNEEFRWGQPAASSQRSGLRFAAAPAQTITQSVQFTLGTLTYFNNPVFGAISAVDLLIGANLSIDGTPLTAGPFAFMVDVDETPNGGNPSACPYPSSISCSDKISIATGGALQTFEIGGQALTLYIDGFLDTNLIPQSSFIAQEQESTAATLVAHFDVASAVPEPASWAMMVLGFGFLGGAMRRLRSPVLRMRVPLPGVIVG
jgi:hypothetical protein